MALPSVSVVIPTYGRRDALADTIAAISADPYPSEIIVVVDGCADGSYELLEKMAVDEPRLRPVWQDNAGAAAARARGVTLAGGEVVLILDDDVVAGPGLARGHARAHATLRDTIVVGYLPTRLPVPRRPGDVATFLYHDDYEAACARYERDPDSLIRHLWAGNMSLRRADALRVDLAGGPRLGRHNDQALGLRCARAGLRAVFDRTLRASHAHARDLAAFARECWQAGSARRTMSALYPDLLAAADPRRELGPAVRVAIDLAAAPAVRRVARPGLATVARAAGHLRLWPVETGCARLLRQVELLLGYRGIA